MVIGVVPAATCAIAISRRTSSTSSRNEVPSARNWRCSDRPLMPIARATRSIVIASRCSRWKILGSALGASVDGTVLIGTATTDVNGAGGQETFVLRLPVSAF